MSTLPRENSVFIADNPLKIELLETKLKLDFVVFSIFSHLEHMGGDRGKE